MIILALEFSSAVRSVAIVENETCRARISENFGKSTGMALIGQLLRESGLAPSNIDRLAIGLGPGSYAGVRSALAIAQGWQLARHAEVVGISSAELLAETAKEEGLRGEWPLALDAQRNEVYRAKYLLTGQAAQLLEPLRIVPAAELIRESQLLGPEANRWHPQARQIFPSAEILARLAATRASVPAEELEPIYLRETTFIKAPPTKNY